MTVLRCLAAMGVIALGLLALSWLQGRFDRADERKAIEAVGGEGCTAQMISRWRGVVRVRCGEKVWQVDVVKGTISGD